MKLKIIYSNESERGSKKWQVQVPGFTASCTFEEAIKHIKDAGGCTVETVDPDNEDESDS